MIHKIRGLALPLVGLIAICFISLSFLNNAFLWLAVVFSLITLIGLYDITQTHHAILRNYPILGHLRFLLEDIGPEMRQYFVESNTSGTPFNRDQRSLIYQRSKDVNDKKPFGTELNLYEPGYTWLAHSLAPTEPMQNASQTMRITVGGNQCNQPYSASIFNISAMSFGSLSANAIRALNQGAAKGGFAHDTGEGGLSRYHREPGGDIIWQVGTAYFGCRTKQGKFDPDQYHEVATLDQVKMIELKLSQGAKPGHGGVLPGSKVSAEIAQVRGIPVGQDCDSPPGHSAFNTPIGLLQFIEQLRSLSGGKPTGFKLCLGNPSEFLAIIKAILETKIVPDFITVDGAEGGTGAAPLEFSDNVGAPLIDGLLFVHNALKGAQLRDQIKIAASAKRTSAVAIAEAMALGADWCNSARGFMLSMGCIQAQRCHTNACPVGIATQDHHLQKALDPRLKSNLVYCYHKNTVESLAELVAAAGFRHPSELHPCHIWRRISATEVRTLDQLYHFVKKGDLLAGKAEPYLSHLWKIARADQFDPNCA